MNLFAAIYTVRFVLDCTSYAKGSPKISFKKMEPLSSSHANPCFVFCMPLQIENRVSQ